MTQMKTDKEGKSVIIHSQGIRGLIDRVPSLNHVQVVGEEELGCFGA
jgi:hypothetical protein